MVRLFALIVLLLSAPALAQSTNAARWLVDQQISDACQGGGGRFTSDTVIERDLTGNGRDDLILSHEGITCADGTRSIYCGMQVCSVLLYVREGGLLVEKASILGGGVTVSNATPPVISGHGHGGGSWSLRWTGRRFR